MKRVPRFLFIVVALGVFCWALPEIASAVEFSAEIVVKTKGEGEMTGKIFVKGDKVRQEWTDEGESQIMIVRPDKGYTWMLTPEEKVYMEVPYEAESKGFDEWTPEREQKGKVVGEETISGLQTKKYEIVEDGEKVTYWVSKKYPFPIRVEDSESVMEYKNIKEGDVSDSLFDMPQGYEKMPMMPPAEDEEKE